MPTALITGGGSGLGAVFADVLARRGHDLVLVGRDGARLDRAAAALRQRHGVGAQALAADLVRPEGRDAVADRLRDPDRPVDLLVNNAGSPSGGRVMDMDLEALDDQVSLNVTAVLHLTRAALGPMLERRDGRIVTVSSFAGYFPMTGSGYGPTKAWELAFTDSLAADLEGTGVRMTALCAGRVRTGRNEHRSVRTGRFRPWLDAEHVVEVCLSDLERGRSLSVPGLLYRVAVDALELPRRAIRRAGRIRR